MFVQNKLENLPKKKGVYLAKIKDVKSPYFCPTTGNLNIPLLHLRCALCRLLFDPSVFKIKYREWPTKFMTLKSKAIFCPVFRRAGKAAGKQCIEFWRKNCEVFGGKYKFLWLGVFFNFVLKKGLRYFEFWRQNWLSFFL